MKKIIVILTAVIAFNTASAQQRNNSYGNDRYEMKDNSNDHHYGNEAHAKEYAYNINNRRNDDRGRDHMDRHDQRNYDYRNNRSMGGYERNRPINRDERPPYFGTGVAAATIAGVLLGVLIAH